MILKAGRNARGGAAAVCGRGGDRFRLGSAIVAVRRGVGSKARVDGSVESAAHDLCDTRRTGVGLDQQLGLRCMHRGHPRACSIPLDAATVLEPYTPP